jgi:hypothetical protein
MNGPVSLTRGFAVFVAALLGALGPQRAIAQTEYYNLDFNRPLRVEDAVPTERRQLDLQLAPLRMDSFLDGSRRWRVDPLVSYGIASMTEIELRAPLLFVQPADPTAPAPLGLTSVGLGLMRALNTETSALPALAVSGEVLVPAGSLAPAHASFGLKALITKTFPLFRLDLNGSYGTYSVASAATVSPACRFMPPGSPGCGSGPTVPDVPCARVPPGAPSLAEARLTRELIGDVPAYSTACLTANTAVAAPASATIGNRWFAGMAIDHAFALSSTLLGADVFAERLIGLSPLVDWTTELGIRHQMSPYVVFDFGVSRHFTGVFPSTAATVGATYAYALHRN